MSRGQFELLSRPSRPELPKRGGASLWLVLSAVAGMKSQGSGLKTHNDMGLGVFPLGRLQFWVRVPSAWRGLPQAPPPMESYGQSTQLRFSSTRVVLPTGHGENCANADCSQESTKFIITHLLLLLSHCEYLSYTSYKHYGLGPGLRQLDPGRACRRQDRC